MLIKTVLSLCDYSGVWSQPYADTGYNVIEGEEMEIVETKYDGTVIVGTHYRCVGSVRGWCGVRHRSNHAAIRCRERDSNGCASQGGYSDRVVCLCDDDGRVKGHPEYDGNRC